MDEELNKWMSLYAQQQIAGTQTAVELGRARARDRGRLVAELAAGVVILAAGVVYLASNSTMGSIVGAALVVFALAGGALHWRSVAGLQQALFASPAEYARELEERNAREIRRLTPVWGFAVAVGMAVLVDVELLFGSNPIPAAFAALIIAAEAGVLVFAMGWRRHALARLQAEKTALAELRV